MTTNQEGVHLAVRDITGTALSYNEDWHALFDAEGITAGTFNERMLGWINATLSTSYTNVNEAMQAFAVDQGFANWASMNTFTTVAPPWSPADITTLAWYDFITLSGLWQDTAGTSAVTGAGQSIARVDDKSGNVRHLLQSTASARPLSSADGAIFVTDDTMSTSGYTPPTVFTFAAAMYSFTSGCLFSTTTANHPIVPFNATQAYPNQANGALTLSSTPYAKSVFVCEFDFDADTYSIRKSAASIGSDSTVRTAIAGVFGIGARQPSTTPSLFLNGTIAEIVLAGALSSTDRALLETYLGAKIGLTI